ncbi:heterodisulfide reductase subunit D [Anaerolineae bacterium]|nr:heterodisulfide reductase subunit D [Anaerolineae bacterium]
MTTVATLDTTLRDFVNAKSQQTINLCFACSKCTAGCPIAGVADLRPANFLRLVQFGMTDALLNNPALWRCLGCDLCGARCPNDVHIGAMLAAVRELAWEESRRASFADPAIVAGMERLGRLRDNIGNAHNVTGDVADNRVLWTQNLERTPEGLLNRKGAESVYFTGCVGALFPQSYRIPQSLTAILAFAHADFTILGTEEWCCGYPLIATGQRERARELMQHNVEQIQAMGARTLVATCPSCYHMWHHEYPVMLGAPLPFEVKHSTQVLAQMVGDGALKLNAFEGTITYHDPCDLGRKSGVIDAPRVVMDAIPSARFVEMTNYGTNALCCGGGGNLETFDPTLPPKIASERLDDAVGTGANLLVSACQQCERTLMGAARKHDAARKARLKIMDIVELVAQQLPWETPGKR